MTDYELEEVINAGLELAIEHFGRKRVDGAEATAFLLGKLMAECALEEGAAERLTARFGEGLRAGSS